MLAGRKLLLADDSPTIQKVVELTFADEGVTVVSVGSGDEALAKLKEDLPDVVLADVCMPPVSGYDLCEHIKQNAELKHIPVMLLVGSFEPFDEVEARRVGADDILTKPFQSIRRLIDKVGVLVSGKQDPDQVPTAELTQVDDTPEVPKMSTDELELTTANTQPLPDAAADEVKKQKKPNQQSSTDDVQLSAHEMETNSSMPPETPFETSDVLLDLGELGARTLGSSDDFVLDIDLDENAQLGTAENGSSGRGHAFVEPEVSAPAAVDWKMEGEPEDVAFGKDTGELAVSAAGTSQFEDTQEWMRRPLASPGRETASVDEAPRQLERVFDERVVSERPAAAGVNAQQLAPEVIEAIARRAVEHLSERVVQQIAWEVVPQLAELMIKRKLEEKETQPK